MKLLFFVFLPAALLLSAPPLPVKTLTPGAIDPNVTQSNIQQTICKSGYTKTVRSVSEVVKRHILQEYGYKLSDSSKVEVDHLISLEIGGSNDPKNLWAQPYNPVPGARQKDVLETHLKRLVCAGTITLRQAQTEISTDWYGAYVKYGLGK